MNKRRILLIAVLAILASLVVSGTIAYYNMSEIAHNVITTGGVEIDLLEWANEEKTEQFPARGIRNVMPGTSVTKIVEIKNIGEQSAFIRISLKKRIKLAKGAEGETDEGLIDLVLNDEDWTYQDGYYYYNQPLDPGQTTTPLLQSVQFKPEMGNLYQGCTVNVYVVAQAVQTAHNGTSALEAKGWPADEDPAAESEPVGE